MECTKLFNPQLTKMHRNFQTKFASKNPKNPRILKWKKWKQEN